MTLVAPDATATYSIHQLIQDLDGIPYTTDPQQLAKLSIDWHTFSPILSQQLAGKRADIVAFPTTEAEVIRVIQSCVNASSPLTTSCRQLGYARSCKLTKNKESMCMTAMPISWIGSRKKMPAIETNSSSSNRWRIPMACSTQAR